MSIYYVVECLYTINMVIYTLYDVFGTWLKCVMHKYIGIFVYIIYH